MELIQKLAQAQILQAYGLEKLAKTKFLELAEKGLLSAADKARLGITDKFTAATGKLKNRMVRGLRGRLYGAGTDLAPHQLARNRTLGGRLGDTIAARHGEIVPNLPTGPASNVGGNVLLSGNMGPAFQTEAKLPKRDANAMSTVRRSVVDHEVAEGAMAAGAAQRARQLGEHGLAKNLVPGSPEELNELRGNMGALGAELNLLHPGTEHAYEGKAFASHHGPAALVAEAQSTFRDPAASRYMDKIRKQDSAEAYTKRKMKQFGHTPAYPMPLGGKQHFALEEAVANMPDNHIDPGAVFRRQQTPGSKLPKGTSESIEEELKDIEERLRKRQIYKARADEERAALQQELLRVQKAEGTRQSPYTDPQEARRRHMALLAAPRNDANPGRRI